MEARTAELESARREARQGVRFAVAEGEHRRPPAFWWALFGAGVLVFEAFVLARWITGPDFKTVPSGPSRPPTYMKVALISWQAIGMPLALGLLYLFLVRPWRRERRVTTDGLLVVAFFVMSFQDPLSDYFGYWFTYNSYMVNFGSWASSVPGWLAYARPGHMIASPILAMPPFYVVALFVACWLGSWVLRTVRARWPRLGPAALVGIVLFPTMVLFDFVLEGVIFMPLGFWQYGGGGLSLFPDAYHKFPISELPTAAAIFSGIIALRFFKNDAGETLVERGVNKMQTGPVRKAVVRFLALAGAVQLIMFCTYNLPLAGYVGAHSAPWPVDTQSRSYFTDYVCGAGTENICPQPGVPNSRGSDSAHIGPNGELRVPGEGAAGRLYGLRPGASISTPVSGTHPIVIPFNNGKRGPFTGRFIGNTKPQAPNP